MFEKFDNSWFVYYVSSASTVLHVHITQHRWAGVCNMVDATHIVDFTLYVTLHMKGLKMTLYMGESGSIQNVLLFKQDNLSLYSSIIVPSLCCTYHASVLYHNLLTNTSVLHCVYQITISYCSVALQHSLLPSSGRPVYPSPTVDLQLDRAPWWWWQWMPKRVREVTDTWFGMHSGVHKCLLKNCDIIFPYFQCT
jgi:hypothetical protein